MKLWPFSKKKKSDSQRAFAAAQFNRLVADWIAMSTSADAEIRGSLKALRARSRQLGRDNDYVRGAFREFQNNIVGQGIPFQSQVRKQRGKALDELVNDAIEIAWARWSKKETCDVAGRLSFCDIERLLVKSLVENGEVCVRKIYQSFGGSKIPFALELIEADQLDDDYNGTGPSGNVIRMGVEIDSWGRPVAYYFHTQHPGDYGVPHARRETNRKRIPANEIIHLFIQDRIGQNRGIPWLVSAMIRLRHMQGYEEAEIVAARSAASLMGFIETDQGELRGEDVQGEQRVTVFEPGVFKQLNPGEKMNVPNIQRPGTQFDPFMRAMLRGVAVGLGPAYTSISGDFSQSNYSSERAALLKERDLWRALQAWLIRNFHQPVFEAWLDVAVLSGAVSLPLYETAPERYYDAIRWLPRGWAWIDPLKEVQAYGEAVDRGFMTSTDVIASQGGDIEETYVTRKREVDLAESLGLEFKQDLGSNSPQFENGNGSETPGDASAVTE